MSQLNEDQCLIRDTVREFTQSRIKPFAAQWGGATVDNQNMVNARDISNNPSWVDQ